jgi:4-hydroxy-2-oxoheptanedioate aldolase
MAQMAFDWIGIDCQHGLIAPNEMLGMLQAVSAWGRPSLVRVQWNAPGEIMKALDSGATGVIVPMINSAADARDAVGACKYPPNGYRSWGPVRAALGNPEYSPESANASTLCVVMIETVEAVAAIDEILSIPGIDAVFIGPADLSLSGGFAPSHATTEAEHVARIEKVRDACVRQGVVPGLFGGGAEATLYWAAKGFQFIALTGDISHVALGAKTLLANVRQQL